MFNLKNFKVMKQEILNQDIWMLSAGIQNLTHVNDEQIGNEWKEAAILCINEAIRVIKLDEQCK